MKCQWCFFLWFEWLAFWTRFFKIKMCLCLFSLVLFGCSRGTSNNQQLRLCVRELEVETVLETDPFLSTLWIGVWYLWMETNISLPLPPLHAGAESRHREGAQGSLVGLPAVLFLLDHAVLVSAVGTVHLWLLPGHQLRSGPVGDGAAF